MQQYQKNLLIARIISGKLLYKNLLICQPSREHRYVAEQVYARAYEDGVNDGLHTTSSLLSWMKEVGYWTDEEQIVVDGIQTDIESLKVALFESKTKNIRNTLNNAKLKLSERLSKKHRWDHLTADHTASLAKTIYLTKKSIRTLEGEFVKYSNIIRLIDYINGKRIGDTEFRELARSEPWISIYNIGTDVFGIPVVDMTDEQKNLICWSTLYTSIKKHEECPSQEIIDDDDMLDGWLIIQKRKCQESFKKKQVEDIIGNGAIRNADEVFIMINNPDNPIDPKIIEDMNDPLALMRKRQRLAYMAEKGTVNELDMPDMRQQINMEMNRLRKGG